MSLAAKKRTPTRRVTPKVQYIPKSLPRPGEPGLPATQIVGDVPLSDPLARMRDLDEEIEDSLTDEDKLTRKERQALLQMARDRFDSAQSAESEQRQRELDDLRFYAGDQWDATDRTNRQGQNAQNGLPPVPPRPCITINETRAPVRNVLNQERNSDLGIELVPADDFGDLDDTPENKLEIEGREGLTRRIQRNSHAKDARTWAFARAVQAGRGYYGVMVRFLPGKTQDQEAYVHRYYNQAAVTIDPSHQRPEGSDAAWGFVGTYMPWPDYEKEFPKAAGNLPNPLLDSSDKEFTSLGEQYPKWFKMDGKQRAVHVVEYYYTDLSSRELVEWSDGSLYWGDEEPPVKPEGVTENSRRDVVEKSIKWAKLDGYSILEGPSTWFGPDLPIVQVLGEELQPYDDQKRAEGMVRPAREANQGLNYMVSKLVEMIGTTPIPPLMVAEGQIEGYEEWYQLAATRVLPYLPYRTRDLEGNPVGAPSAVNRETPIQAVSSALVMFSEKVQQETNVHNPSQGDADPALRSAKAITAVISADQHGTSNFLDNLVRSMEYEGQIINNLLYPIYGRKPGRIARILNREGDAETISIGGPGQTKGGQPLRSFTLTKDARFNVAIKVTKNFDTRRQQEAAIVGELLSANPANMAIIGDLFFKNLDGPGHDEMAERYKVMLDPKIQQMIQAKQNGQAPLPPEVQQQLQEGQQLIGQLTEALNKSEQEKQAKVIEQQGKAQITQIQESAENERNKDNNEVKLAVAALGGKFETLSNAMTLFMEERARLGSEQHETSLAAADAGHSELLAQQQHDQALQQSDQQHQQTLEVGQQQAALAPPPAEGGE